MKENESVNEENENEQPDEIQLVCALEKALQKCVLDSVQQTDIAPSPDAKAAREREE